jgi:hypothetical protein
MNEELTAKTDFVPQPWGVQFTWKDKSVKVTLKNGEDLIKVAEMLSGLFTASGIENDLEISH